MENRIIYSSKTYLVKMLWYIQKLRILRAILVDTELSPHCDEYCVFIMAGGQSPKHNTHGAIKRPAPDNLHLSSLVHNKHRKICKNRTMMNIQTRRTNHKQSNTVTPQTLEDSQKQSTALKIPVQIDTNNPSKTVQQNDSCAPQTLEGLQKQCTRVWCL